ncbi:hypothetical protein SAMN05428954_6829 [Streptomyces sp. 2112.3]|nr:hypothetical protein BX261_0444 [Streptomyces sp. 2321.6]SDR57933.1 hypothetical protein SAMN05216511_6777 [Streptomyces sp. KS_16]SEB81384.1 hypothetical protein SAMN05428940_0444 [Streptomyces sp. 2133.1]SEF13786.1 hypothetical protein SAMN05428954_6829 [Streptomyces sp. 2112.3]SNC61263.1 hypothetical protein SAMN06272741_0445 [Streptomyces sp. 2114.4]
MVRITANAAMGWRLHKNYMIGWIKERKPYERLIGLAESVTGVLAEFPPVYGHGQSTTVNAYESPHPRVGVIREGARGHGSFMRGAARVAPGVAAL